MNESNAKPLSESVEINDALDQMTIYGLIYTGELFRGLGFRLDEQVYFQIIERKNGTLTISTDYRHAHLLDNLKNLERWTGGADEDAGKHYTDNQGDWIRTQDLDKILSGFTALPQP